MIKALAVAAILVEGAASAQSVTSYRSDKQAAVRGDANKIVCEQEEKIGTRLGAKKVCLTVAEWRARQLADREQTEGIQAGTRARCSNDAGCDPPSGF
jgi:hypothetical protein